jgi:hypothetical protein
MVVSAGFSGWNSPFGRWGVCNHEDLDQACEPADVQAKDKLVSDIGGLDYIPISSVWSMGTQTLVSFLLILLRYYYYYYYPKPGRQQLCIEGIRHF